MHTVKSMALRNFLYQRNSSFDSTFHNLRGAVVDSYLRDSPILSSVLTVRAEIVTATTEM